MLERQRAKIGDEFAPAHILTGIDAAREQIEQCDDEIEELEGYIKRALVERKPFNTTVPTIVRTSSPSQIRFVQVIIILFCLVIGYLITKSGLANMNSIIAFDANQNISVDTPVAGTGDDSVLDVGSTWSNSLIALTLLSKEYKDERVELRWRLQNVSQGNVTFPNYYLPVRATNSLGEVLQIAFICDQIAEDDCFQTHVLSPLVIVEFQNEVIIGDNNASLPYLWITTGSHTAGYSSRWFMDYSK